MTDKKIYTVGDLLDALAFQSRELPLVLESGDGTALHAPVLLFPWQVDDQVYLAIGSTAVTT